MNVHNFPNAPRTSDKAVFVSNKKYASYKCWTCAELYEAFTFLMEHIYVHFEGMVYQQIVAIPMGTNCAPLIADLFCFYFVMRGILCLTFTNRNGTTL